MRRHRQPEVGPPVSACAAGQPANAEGALADAVEELRSAAQVAARKARALGRPILAAATARIPCVDPVDIFERAGPVADDRTLWVRPNDRFGLVGVGSARAFAAEGPDRFARAGAAWQSVLDQSVAARGTGASCWGAGPVAIGGFSFAPQQPTSSSWKGYPAGLLVLPRLSVTSTVEASWLTLAVMAGPAHTPSHLDDEVEACLDLCSDVLKVGSPEETGGPGTSDLAVIEEFPPAEAWKESVSAAARAVREGSLRKVVLSRGLRVRVRCLNPVHILRTLRAGYPGCTLFAVARGNRCFLGATPERLARIRDGEVDVTAIAGSAPRGLTEDEDRRLGELLLASIKDRTEHAVVVDALRDALSALCATISVGASPVLIKLHNVQHLQTPLTARLRHRRTVFELADLLHPTPAVGGVPRDDALRWIDGHEGWDRGWYAGAVGWMDSAGEGECAIAIRSALLRGTEALLFAGCGIVADSDPDQEYAESSLKLEAVLSALNGA